LANRLPGSPIFEQLVADVRRIQSNDHRRRLGLLCGFQLEKAVLEQQWDRVADLFSHASAEPREAVLHTDAVWEVANALNTSFTATLEHLCNLGFIHEVTRDALRAQTDERVRKSGMRV
jgi:hypothetical protein